MEKTRNAQKTLGEERGGGVGNYLTEKGERGHEKREQKSEENEAEETGGLNSTGASKER